MRALPLLLLGLAVVSAPALAQMKLQTKPAPSNGPETRYFTSIDGLMDGNADVVLKETRQGKTVTAAMLDVCYPADKSSDRKDRFVANLTVNGQTLSGTTQSVADKQPITVKLNGKQTGDSFEFRGQITIGQTVTEVASTDNSDLSEKEFQDNQATEDGITPQPKDFTDVSPESIGVRVKLDAAADFLKSLKGEAVEVGTSSLAVTCEARRSGEQTINLTVDPEHELITRQRQNLGQARVRGVSVEADVTPAGGLRLRGGYVLTGARVGAFAPEPGIEGNRLPQVPGHRASLRLDYVDRRLSFSLRGRFESTRYDDDQNRLPLDGLFVLDLGVERPLGESLAAFVSVENLFDARYPVQATPVELQGTPFGFHVGLRLDLRPRGPGRPRP